MDEIHELIIDDINHLFDNLIVDKVEFSKSITGSWDYSLKISTLKIPENIYWCSPYLVECSHEDAVKWNPYNKVVQCHKCGQIFTPKENKNDK